MRESSIIPRLNPRTHDADTLRSDDLSQNSCDLQRNALQKFSWVL